MTELGLAHGDFQPNNLIIASNKVEAIVDWELACRAYRWHDIAQLLRHTRGSDDELSLARGFNTHAKLPLGWLKAARCYDAARVALGLSNPAVQGSDIELWLAYVDAALDAVATGDASESRRVVSLLRRPIGMTRTA